ncbi:hypothetical protein BJX99DRAFT_255635 [Aspergillus californicus]
MPSIGTSTLSLAILVASYFHNLCTTSPNQANTLYRTDRIHFIASTVVVIGTQLSSLVNLYHALVILFFTSSPADRDIVARICPYPERLNPDAVAWNPRTVGYLAIFAIGTYVRLSAYGGLGRNFTFQLSTPDRLVTTGVYRYLQHPSYTGLLLVEVSHIGLVVNCLDTPAACWIPNMLLGLLRDWQVPMLVSGAAIGCAILGVRMRDEERMLREKFGKEWEVWHASTARLIPGFF